MSGWLEPYLQTSSRESLAALLDQLPSGLLGTDGQGKLTYGNTAARTMLRRGDADLIGKSVEEILGFPAGQPLPEPGESRVSRVAGADEEEERLVKVTRHPAPGGETWVLEDVTAARFLRRALLEAERREQRRLAQVLHDNLSGQLLGAAFSAKIAANQLARQPPLPTVEDMNELARLVNECAAQLKEVTADPALRAAEEGDLPGALHAMAGQQRRAKVEILLTSESRIDIGQKTPILYSLVREAVNAVVSAGASQVTVMVRPRDSSTEIKIISNEPAPGELTQHPKTMARRLFEYRCEAIGAQAGIKAGNDDSGSSINLSLPFEQ